MIKRAKKTSGAALVEIYQKRQPKRPHYVGRLMELRKVTRGQMLEELEGLDKGLLSRWLDKDDPSTPGKEWSQRLGRYFSVPPDHDFVNIFDDPDVDWLARKLRGRSSEEKDRIIGLIDSVFPSKQAQ